MTQSAETVVAKWHRSLELAAQENKMLWLFLAPQYEHEAWRWIASTKKLLQKSGLDDFFYFYEMDSLSAPEMDQAAQYIMQSSHLPAGWPINLMIHPFSKKAIVGFHMMNAEEMLKFLGDLTREWTRSPQNLKLFAEKTTGAAVLGDPQRLSQKLDEKDKLSLEELNSFFITPLIQSLDPRTGLLGSGDKLNLFTGAYHAMAVSSSDEMFRLSQACLTRLFLSGHADTLEALLWSSQDEKRLLARFADQLAGLDVISTIVQKSPNPFLLEVGAELVVSILNRFITLDQDGNFSGVKAFVEYPTSAFRIGTADLLEALDSGERLVAQKFFGLSADAKLPFLQTTVLDLAAELNMEPMDVKLALLTIKKKLRAFRQKRLEAKANLRETDNQKPKQTIAKKSEKNVAKKEKKLPSTEGWEAATTFSHALSLRAYSTLAQSAAILKITIGQDPRFAALKAYVEQVLTSKEGEERPQDLSRDVLFEIERAIAEIECAKELALQSPPSFDFWKNLSESVMKASYLDLNSEWGFLDARSNGVDHLGPSLMSRQLELLSRAMKVPQLKAFLNPHIHYACEEGLDNLRLLKRLGVHVGHVLGSLSELIGSVPVKSELRSFAREDR